MPCDCEARVRTTRHLTPLIRLLEIDPDGGAGPYSPGSHIDVTVHVAGQPEVRSYSLIGEGPSNGAYRIAVQRAANSRGGSRYMWTLAAGARLTISEPRNLFGLSIGCPEYLLVAGGIGITPILGMAYSLERTGGSFRLLYAGRCRAEMAFLEELEERLDRRLQVFVSEEDRRIDLDTEIGRLCPGAELYVCGPMRLLDAARRVWLAAGRPPAAFRFETFASSGAWPPEPFVVKVRDRGVAVTVLENQTVLTALQQAGVEIMSDCLRGECGLCAVDVIEAEGRLDHRDVFLGPDQKAAGKKLCACVSRAVGGAITIDTGFRAA